MKRSFEIFCSYISHPKLSKLHRTNPPPPTTTYLPPPPPSTPSFHLTNPTPPNYPSTTNLPNLSTHPPTHLPTHHPPRPNLHPHLPLPPNDPLPSPNYPHLPPPNYPITSHLPNLSTHTPSSPAPKKIAAFLKHLNVVCRATFFSLVYFDVLILVRLGWRL